MKKKSLISIVVVSVFLISSLALAGFDPTPFRSGLIKLRIIENRLNSINDRIRAVLATPPNDIRPIRVLRINFMAYRLGFLNWFMVSTMDGIIDAVLTIPPDDQMPVRDALERIAFVMSNDTPEGGIAEVVEAYLNEHFPAGAPIQPEFRRLYNALIRFSGNADMITGNVTDYIDQIDAVLSDCSSYDNEADCIAAGCTWIFDTLSCDDLGS